MSDLDTEAVLATIRRENAETGKLIAEQRKLFEEANKLSRDRFLAPLVVLTAAFTGLGGAAIGTAVTQALLRWHP